MVLTYELAVQVTLDCESVCTMLKDTLRRVEQFLDHNSALSIDWAAGTLPTYLVEDTAGNLEGRTYSRADVANAIGSLAKVRALLRNQDLTGAQGDHLGNLEKLTRSF